MSVEADLLTGLQALLAAATSTPGTLFQLPPAPDAQWALAFTRGPTDPHGRWGQGVVTLQTRGTPGQPHTVHAIADPLVRRLIDVAGVRLGAVAVNTVEHRGTSTGVDGNRRSVRADTFAVDLDYQA